MFTITTFQAVLKGISRPVFDQCVYRLHADKYCKQFNHWNHLVAMVYAQLSNASSLRTLELSFNSHASFHYQFGSGAVHRSTLSDANKARSGVVFDDTAAWLISQLSGKLRREAMGLMYLLDSTSITLKGRQFDRWTLTSRTCHTQGIKLHVLLDAANRIPEWYSFSAANVNDVVQANRVPLQPGRCTCSTKDIATTTGGTGSMQPVRFSSPASKETLHCWWKRSVRFQHHCGAL